MRRRFKHFTYTDRVIIETMLRDGKKPRDIARRLQVHISSIYRERERGRYEHTLSDWSLETRYAPEIAEQKYRTNLAAKGAGLKIGNDHKLAKHIENKIIEDKFSPAAVLGEIQRLGLVFSVSICASTLYSYIDKGIFLRLTNKHLPVKPTKQQRKYRHVRPKRAPRGDSIEKRPEEVEERKTFGHWEMDTLKGKRDTKKVLLVLTERFSRNELQIPMRQNTAENVVSALDELERKYGQMFSRVFRSITVDNGSEFSDCDGMERSRTGNGKRTKIYYCHPYSSYERGSNENQNRMIRRHIPKGTPIEKVPEDQIKEIEIWLNGYPRKIFDWRTSAEIFEEQLKSLQNQAI
jgi:IS30 family transposase